MRIRERGDISGVNSNERMIIGEKHNWSRSIISTKDCDKETCSKVKTVGGLIRKDKD